MTLARQLLLGMSVIFLLGLAGIAGIYIQNARVSLQEQLESHAQDAATSLGLSLGMGLAEGRAAFAETTINALFDRGFYEGIVFVSPAGETLVERHLPATEAQVPAWFVKLLPLHAPTATSLVTQGWRQAGRVAVTSHPRYAYQQLWRTGTQTLGWLALIYAFAFVAMRVFVTGILRPLEEIENTAAAIGRREYRTMSLTPRARELRHVVQAINSLSSRVREAIEAESARAERLQREAFLDALTGLPNRRGFGSQFDARVREDRDVHSGALLMFEFNDFAGLNRVLGHERGDELLVTTARTVAAGAGPDALLGRWAGANLLLALPNVSPAQAQSRAGTLCANLQATIDEQGYGPEARFFCGVACFESGKPALGNLLSVADAALLAARERGGAAYALQSLDAGETAVPGSGEWRQRIEAALAERRLVLFGQTAESLPERKRMHVEVTARMVEGDGEELPAARFLPMAARHGLVSALDRRVVENVIDVLETGYEPELQIAVNISAQSANDGQFVRWLEARLDEHARIAPRMVFEMAESAVMRDSAAAQAFFAAARGKGALIALDHFGTHSESLHSLQRFLPDYVKLAASHTAALTNDESTRFFVGSLIRIASSLDIRVIALAVEHAEMLPILAELGFSGFQGYAGSRPSRFGPPRG